MQSGASGNQNKLIPELLMFIKIIIKKLFENFLNNKNKLYLN